MTDSLPRPARIPAEATPLPPPPGAEPPATAPAAPASDPFARSVVRWDLATTLALLLPGPLLSACAIAFGLGSASGSELGLRTLAIVLVGLAPWLYWLVRAPDAATTTTGGMPALSAGTGLGPQVGVGADPDQRLRFVASMGHDLRSPLNAMLGFADLLQITAGPEDAGQADSVEVIRQRTSDLLVLIDDMLLWAKLESGRLQMSPTPVAVDRLLQQAAELAETRSGARGLRVQWSAPSSLPAVHVDAERVIQAIVALLHDAVHASRPDPVQLSARLTRSGVCIEAHDPGLLVRSSDREAFFEPFRPSFAPSGKRVAGLGVGVACARAFIRAHGGELSLTSPTSGGTTFSMMLPPPPQS